MSPINQSDAKYLADLLMRCRDGDNKSKEILCKKIEKILRAYFYNKFGDSGIIDDLCQDVQLKLLKNISSIKDPTKLRQFVTKVAMHVSSDHLRNRYRGKENTKELDNAAQNIHTETVLINHINLMNGLSQVGIKTRRALLMWADGYNMKEISERSGASVSAVKMQIKRGLENLRVKFYL